MKKWIIPMLTAAGLLLASCGKEDVIYRLGRSSSAISVLSETAENSADMLSDPEDNAASSGEDSASEKNAEERTAAEEDSKLLYVYVCGAVNRPGVYQLPEGSRVYEALASAGGLTDAADAKSLNQAEELQDGEQITVWTTEETASGAAPAGKQTDADGNQSAGSAAGSKVNINTAGKEELMTLPGIGEARAEAIITYRTQNGAFSDIEEIQNIEGIKEKSFAKLKDLIEV